MGCCSNTQRTIEYQDKFNYKKNFINENNIKSINDIKLISSNLVYGSNQPFSKNYKILSSLGGGSYGKVYKCLHLITNQIRAIKVIKIPEKKDSDLNNNSNNFTDKVFKEIELLAHLDHPHIIKIYEFYKDEYNYFISTEFLEGGDLYDYISKLKTFTEIDAARIIVQVLSAVNYLHTKGIAHRDLKPENIVVEYNVLENLIKEDLDKRGLKITKKIIKEIKYENKELMNVETSKHDKSKHSHHHHHNNNNNNVKEKEQIIAESNIILIDNAEKINVNKKDNSSQNISGEKKENNKEYIINIKAVGNKSFHNNNNSEHSNSTHLVIKKGSGNNLQIINKRNSNILNYQTTASPKDKNYHSTSLFSQSEKEKNKKIHTLSNINVKLIDFGASTYYKKNEILNAKVGTPYYIAPEVLRREYTYKCDIWSIGVILYILLTGKPPFDGKSSEVVFNKILSGKYDKSGSYNKLSSSAKELISKMLTYNYKDRPNCKECLESQWIINNTPSNTTTFMFNSSLVSQDNNENSNNLKSTRHNKHNNTIVVNPTGTKTNNNLLNISSQNIILKKSSSNISGSDEGNKFKDALDNLKKFSKKNKFQQATIAYLVRHVANKEMFDELREIFKAFDTDNNGTLSYEEIKAGFKKFIPSHEELELDYDDIIKQLDQDQNNNIEYEEFLRNMVDMRTLLTKQNLQIAFNMFDTDKNGELSLKEIKDALGVVSDSQDFDNYNKNKKKEKENSILNKILKSMDSDGNGSISFDEFYELMMDFME